MVISTWKERSLIRKQEPYLWEFFWIDFLCSKIPSLRHVSSDLKSDTEPVILIISDNGDDKNKSKKISSFIEKTSQKRLTGIFHLSDEWFSAPFEQLYKHSAFVVRVGHWAKHFPRHVLTVPLGLSSEFIRTSDEQQLSHEEPSSQRKWIWTFVGQVRFKEHRQMMLDQLSCFDEHFQYIGITDWSKPSSDLPKSEYAKALSSSIFAPCPQGRWRVGDCCVDGFRTWEAVALGAIPIVDSQYYRNAFGAPFPVVLPDWSDAVSLIKKTLADSTRLDHLQHEISGWWQHFKQDLPDKVAEHIMKCSFTRI
jgi:hypothetical protein